MLLIPYSMPFQKSSIQGLSGNIMIIIIMNRMAENGEWNGYHHHHHIYSDSIQSTRVLPHQFLIRRRLRVKMIEFRIFTIIFRLYSSSLLFLIICTFVFSAVSFLLAGSIIGVVLVCRNTPVLWRNEENLQ